jgi:hypothetical protein
MERLRTRSQHGAYDLQFPEHRSSEDVESCAKGEQQLGDVASPDVRGGSESGLPVAAAPVPAGIYERRVVVESLPNGFEIPVGIRDELADEVGLESGRSVRGRHD